MFGVHYHLFQKVQGTPRSVSCIPLPLWTFRSLTPLLQGPIVLPNQPCATKLHLEQLNKLCIPKYFLVLPCLTKYYLVLPCTTMHHQVLPCAAMHYQVLPWTCSTRSWHCAHDHPPTCTCTDCPVPPISFCSIHCLYCLKASLLALRSHI